MMLRRDWPQLREGAETRRVAAHTFDVSEYLWKLRTAGEARHRLPIEAGQGRLPRPCHQRMQFIGNKGADLMRLAPDTEVEVVDRCSHHDGTWGMKKDSHEVSLRYGKRLFDDMNDAEADSSSPIARWRRSRSSRERDAVRSTRCRRSGEPTGSKRMRKIERADVRDITSTRSARWASAAGSIELKKRRRVGVGRDLTFVFENRDTMIFQTRR